MNTKRTFTAVAGALIAGLVLGSVVSGFAVNTPKTAGSAVSTASAACNTAGLRLGATMRDSGGRLLDIVAKLTGKSTTSVIAQRQAGKTLAQIAAESKVSSSAVIEEAVKVRKQILAAKVKDGTITQEQADAMLANMKTRLTSRIDSANTGCNGEGCGAGGGRGEGLGMGRGGGRRGQSGGAGGKTGPQ